MWSANLIAWIGTLNDARETQSFGWNTNAEAHSVDHWVIYLIDEYAYDGHDRVSLGKHAFLYLNNLPWCGGVYTYMIAEAQPIYK